VPDLIVLETVAWIDDLDIGIPVYQQIKRIESLQLVPVLFWNVPNPTYTNPKAQQLGVAGCVMMPSQPNELIEARDTILAGGTYYPPLS
jgi:DNA-binding NarL/FixJ family response regulator